MQSWFIAWLALPVVVLFLSLFAFYLATAALMVWLTFRSPLSGRIHSFKGVVAPFFGSTAIIFGLLLAFLSNDIWDRNRQADRIVLIESNTLVALYSLSAASGADNSRLRSATGAAAEVANDRCGAGGPAARSGADRCLEGRRRQKGDAGHGAEDTECSRRPCRAQR